MIYLEVNFQSSEVGVVPLGGDADICAEISTCGDGGRETLSNVHKRASVFLYFILRRMKDALRGRQPQWKMEF